MLQRIQTVWLLLAGILALLTLKMPYYAGIKDPAVAYNELTALNAGVPILLVTITVAVVAFVCIGLYKNRTTQLRLCVVGILAETSLVFLYFRKISLFTEGTYALTSILHLGVILLFVLAARAINKDEKLIRESDRLR